jgi:hypothetical protein
LRLFSFYLAKINARDTSTRKVRFPILEFQRIMGITEIKRISYYKRIFRKMLGYTVVLSTPSGGIDAFQVFSRFTLEKDEDNEWYVEIDAHDSALPLLFNFKEQYFTYSLWNTLYLSSVNHVRMYEVLKQHEYLVEWEVTVIELKELLGIQPDEYVKWEPFKRRVLDSSQKALAEKTDIVFTYKRGKCGNGGKWITIIFNIHPNVNYKEPSVLDDLLPEELSKPTHRKKKAKPFVDDNEDVQPLDIDIGDSDIEPLAELDDPKESTQPVEEDISAWNEEDIPASTGEDVNETIVRILNGELDDQPEQNSSSKRQTKPTGKSVSTKKGEPKPEAGVRKPAGETYQYSSEQIEFMAGAVNNEFNDLEMKFLLSILSFVRVPDAYGSLVPLADEFAQYQFLMQNYEEMNVNAQRTHIYDRLKYLIKLLRRSPEQ